MLRRPRTVFSEDHEIFRRAVRRFVEVELVPHHPAWEEAGIVPREAWRKAGAAGLLCCDIPADYGGAGGDFGHCAVVTEELARANLSGPGFVVHSDMVATYITRFGTEAQKRRWLPGMCDGSLIGAIAMTEPDAGSDLKGMRTRAVRDGDHYVLSGQKTYISNGQNAHLVVTAAKTDPAAGARGISLIVVETDTPGFRRGRNLHKLGMPAADTSELFYDEVRVPVANRLGEEGRGFAMLMTNLARERLVQAVRGSVVAETVIDWTVAYTRQRKAFGHTIADFQNTRFVLAELAAKTAAARALTDRLIALQLDGTLDPVEAGMAKLFCTDLQCEVVDRCLQLFGGAGYMMETPIAKAYADARITRIAGGAAEVMKEIIGRRLFADAGQ
ncbi:acyl-CoA dehydrogenase family protein [Paracraurococcus ruber]|uniref:Acyl-[acyl-carrier-protein] dehydrogenase MbtN n=1 Tax=Paracraurococcus ruber TaxID=77675 RepID=A0ABS1D4H4_9PROT|nr:acyl-CoA dehydrogenase family protein [Paracraurococcus ruber]MBK1661162.1 acyl-CoA dehydrogenase [Paracraurococcus ruber]TDG30286.1 acyl-CoA dehydrogenase [Paracraurococcus ruber]